MPLLPTIAVALAAGLAVCEPGLAAVLALPALFLRPLRPLRVPTLAFLTGALLSAPPALTPLLASLPDGAPLVRVRGTVRRGPDLPHEGRTRFVLDVRTVGGRPVTGRVLVLAPGDAPLPAPGAEVEATGRLLRPREAENPGERGPREAQAERGITHYLALRSGRALTVLAPAPALGPRAIVHRSRLALDRAVTRLSPSATRGLLSALLLGRRDRLPTGLYDDFRRSGASHFLAISGLHVGLLAGFLWLLLRPLPLPRPAAAVIVASGALFYAAVTGLRPPALRAGLLVALYAGGIVLRRPPRLLDLLCLAAVVILFADPPALERAGFQLSFVAVLSILHLARPLEEGLFSRWKLIDRFSVPRARPWPVRVLRRYLVTAVPVSLAAWFGTAPLALVHFGTVSSLVLPTNLLVFPLVALLVPVGLLSAVTGFALPATILTKAAVVLVSLLAGVPGAAITVPPPPLALVIAWYGALLAAGRAPALGRRSILLLLAGLAALTASGPLRRTPPPEPRLTVLSVGHGLATVLETPAGGVLVYDAGSRRPALYRRILLPWLRSRGIWRIDVLVTSHDDEDHVSAVPALLRSLPVGRYVPPGAVRSGDRIELAGATIRVLGPPPGLPAGGNDASTVLWIRAGDLRAILPGDIEEEGIARLLATENDLRTEVLLLPHHGRPTTAAAALLERVRPRILLASAGRTDPLDPAYAGAVRTAASGAIVIRPGGRISGYRARRTPDPPPRDR